MGGFHHGFAESRVGMDGFAEFAGRDFQMHRRAGFRDQIGRMGSDHVDAEDLIGLGIGDDLAETVGVVDGHGFSEGGEGELADAGLNAFLVALFLGFAQRTDFRRGENASGDQSAAVGILLAAGHVGGDGALGAGRMRQLNAAGAVADGENAGDVGAAAGIHGDPAAFGSLDAGNGQIQAVQHVLASDRNQQIIRGNGFIADLAGDALGGRLDVGKRLAGLDDDAGLFHLGSDGPGAFAVDRRHDGIHHFGDGDLGAEFGEEAGEFAADDAAAEDQQGFRHFRNGKQFGRGDHAFMTRDEAGDQGFGTGGDDDLRSGQFVDRFRAVDDFDRFLAGEGGLSSEDRGTGCLEQSGNAAVQGLDHFVLAFHHRGPVGCDGAFDLHAEIGGVFRLVIHFRAGDQGLGGDTADIQTGSPEFHPFDQSCFRTVFGSPDGRHVTAGTSADHNHIKFLHRIPP